jgi:pyruvate/2-oxoglutarate dehydrogenase complex dihydrolipoamide dehydrogenase (E3) component
LQVLVDAEERTTNPAVYCIGDAATGIESHSTAPSESAHNTNLPLAKKFASVQPQERPELTPVAIMAGKLLARRLMRASDERMNYELVLYFCLL